MKIGIPSCITDVEKRAVQEAALKSGAKEVQVIEESLAAAIGAQIPIHEPAGHMVCDIGGGTTEVSVISLGGMVVTSAIRLGGDEFDESIIKHVRSVHNLIIGQQTAERLKIEIGNACQPTQDIKTEKMEIKGGDAITGLPRRLEIDSVEVREALKDPVTQIVEEIKRTVRESRQLVQRLGREPTDEEVAEQLGWPVSRVKQVKNVAREPISLETPIGEEEDSLLGDFIEDKEVENPAVQTSYRLLQEQLKTVLSTLPPREQEVLKMRFGLEDGYSLTLEEVGLYFNVTRERIRQIEAKALRRLRHPRRSSGLRDYIDI